MLSNLLFGTAWAAGGGDGARGMIGVGERSANISSSMIVKSWALARSAKRCAMAAWVEVPVGFCRVVLV